MVRRLFFSFTVISLALIIGFSFLWLPTLYFLIPVVPIILIGLHDITCSHNILRNYPVIGHFRYMFEFVRPEIQQYFVATNLSGRPFSREARSLVYERAKNLEDTHPFGTEHDINSFNYEYLNHSMNVQKVDESIGRITVGGENCKKPYHASRINISAMSYGALGVHAVRALNRGAKLGNFAQNTGEGGLTPHHLKEGGDIFWQIGTAYFGCRTKEGNFDPDQFVEKVKHKQVRMVEIKISQGAKPSHGGVLPAAKITKEIAEIRGVEMGKDCLSPPTHTSFSTPEGLCHFIQQLRDLSGGLPIGFKLCIGHRSEFMGICKAMLKTQIFPDFITVDGAEGGTGAAPVEYSNRFGAPLNEGLAFVQNCLVGCNIRDKIRIIASGKILSSFDIIHKMALGADMVNMARPMLFAIGCIQALRCNTNTCPTGITTNDPRRKRAIVIKEKAVHVKNFHAISITRFQDMLGAMGLSDPKQLNPNLIFLRTNETTESTYGDAFHYVEPGNFLSDRIDPHYKDAWEKACAEHF